MTATWAAPANNGSAITDYDVQYREGTETGNWDSHTHNGTATVATVTGLKNGVEYQVQVAAINSQGRGAWSQSTLGTPFAVPTIPTNVTIVGGDKAFTINWEEPADIGGFPIQGYRLYWWDTSSPSNVNTVTLSRTSRSLTIPSLTNGEEYSVYIIAYTSIGDSPQSSTLTVTLAIIVPGAPTGLTLTAGGQQITALWTAPSSDGGSPITGYRVQHRLSTASNWPNTYTTVTATTTTITGLTNGSEYEVRVAATNQNGVGVYSGSPYPTSTPAHPITVTGVAVSGIATKSATITATLDNPDAQSATVHIRYQSTPTTSTWTPKSSVTSSGTSAVFDNELDNAFAPGTEYTVQVSIDSNFATFEAVTFTTLLLAVVPPDGLTVTKITTDSATFTATIAYNYGAQQTVNFQYYIGSSVTGDIHTAIGTTDAEYKATGLAPGTDYNVRSYTTAGGASTAITSSFRTLALPSISTLTAENVDLTTATLVAKIDDDNGNESTVEFGYKETAASNWQTGTAVGTASVRFAITGLTPGTAYDMRARIGTMAYLTGTFTTGANYATNVNIAFSASTTATFDVEFTNPTSKDETVYLRYKPVESSTWLPPPDEYITEAIVKLEPMWNL